MPSVVRSYSKINLGLAIGPPRPDGFHSLVTLYQTLALHDLVTVTASPAPRTRIQLTCNDPRVPRDPRNTAWKMVARTLDHIGLRAAVSIHIQKNLPIQGGMGAGSANAAAALIGLERELARELALKIPAESRLAFAAEVGSDVPLFLIGGAVLGSGRGQLVTPAPDLTLAGNSQIPCVIALPEIGVSTPKAFRDWDALLAAESGKELHHPQNPANLEKLSRAYASVFSERARIESERAQNELREVTTAGPGASGILPEPGFDAQHRNSPEKLHGPSREQLHSLSAGFQQQDESGFEIDLAENSLLAFVRTGIENDFETVVFPQYPRLREIKRHLMGSQENAAVYAALSGSGSALFGLFRSAADADAAQQRLQQHGVKAIVTSTMPRPLYWSNMFAE